MVFQSINVKLNKKKNIGKVIFIVEGERKEIKVLNKIFKEILDYTIVNVPRTRNPYLFYKSSTNEHSEVFIINSETSNINSVSSESGKNYLDQIYESLFNDYDLDPTDAAIYYIFDRDPKSNASKVVLDLIDILGNSRDNGFESNGLLLINYPNYESFIVSCFKKNCYRIKMNTHEIKKYLGDNNIQQNNLKSESLVNATQEMINALRHIIKTKVRDKDLDAFSKINKKIYIEQEKKKNSEEQYKLLSLFMVSFWDLGIIEII